jgi:hypothetical protein
MQIVVDKSGMQFNAVSTCVSSMNESVFLIKLVMNDFFSSHSFTSGFNTFSISVKKQYPRICQPVTIIISMNMMNRSQNGFFMKKGPNVIEKIIIKCTI